MARIAFERPDATSTKPRNAVNKEDSKGLLEASVKVLPLLALQMGAPELIGALADQQESSTTREAV